MGQKPSRLATHTACGPDGLAGGRPLGRSPGGFGRPIAGSSRRWRPPPSFRPLRKPPRVAWPRDHGTGAGGNA